MGILSRILLKGFRKMIQFDLEKQPFFYHQPEKLGGETINS